MKRIDSLKPGTTRELQFNAEFQGPGRAYREEATFLGIEGTGDERRARFDSGYEWEAYRYNGHWAYGSSAETLRLIREVDVP